MTRGNCARGMCERLETCMDSHCTEHPLQPWNLYGAGRPVPPKPEPKQPDADTSYRRGLWLVMAACGLIYLIFLLAAYVSVRPSLH